LAAGEAPSAPAAAEQARRVGKVTPETSESVVLKLSENQLEEFRECFNAFDKDGGGSIDSHELQALMRSLGQDPTKEELAKMVALADADGSGDIDFCEFVTLIAHKMKSEQEGGKNTDRLMKAFSVFDVDGSGFIDMHEMRRMMVNLGEDMTIEEVDEILDSFDEDGDGQISPQEFADAVMAEQQSGTQALIKDKEKKEASKPGKTPPPTPLPK